MNNLIRAITGRASSGQKLTESDVVPVPGGALPRKTYSDRLAQLRIRRGEDPETGDVKRDVVRESEVWAVLGEDKGDVIPADAKEMNKGELPGNVTTRLNTIKDVVEEPGRPRDPDEVFISPKSALTAPDATPDSMKPSDPSNLPNVQKSTFTVAQASEPQGEQPGEQAPEATSNGSMDTATRTMDLLLGRRRVGAPAKKAEEFAATGAITSEAQALASLGIAPSGGAVSGDSLLGQGREMPSPTGSDSKAIYESARRWM